MDKEIDTPDQNLPSPWIEFENIQSHCVFLELEWERIFFLSSVFEYSSNRRTIYSKILTIQISSQSVYSAVSMKAAKMEEPSFTNIFWSRIIHILRNVRMEKTGPFLIPKGRAIVKVPFLFAPCIHNFAGIAFPNKPYNISRQRAEIPLASILDESVKEKHPQMLGSKTKASLRMVLQGGARRELALRE